MLRRRYMDDFRFSDTLLGFASILIVVMTIVLLTVFAGCASPGYARWEYEDGEHRERIVVQQPNNSVEPATLARTPDGGMDASTGRSQRVDHVGLAQVRYRVWIGAGVLLLGLATLVGRAWIPVVPMSASLLAIGAGIAIILLPPMPPTLTYGALGLVAVLYVTGGWDNLVKLRTPQPARNLVP